MIKKLGVASFCVSLLCATAFAENKSNLEQALVSSIASPVAMDGVVGPAANTSVPLEDLQILKDIFKDKIATSDKFVDQAEGLTYQVYNKGSAITLAQCQAIEAKMSKNYPLHTYDDYSDMKTHQGVHVCPPLTGDGMGVFDGDWVMAKSIEMSLSTAPINNLLGVKGNSVLTIAYRKSNSVNYLRQYLLDSNYKMIQFNWANSDVVPQFYVVISATNANGDVLSKTYRWWKNPNDPYLWKHWAGFVSAKGDVSPASRYVQNDGKGVEVEQRSYIAPYNMKWDAFELSPYTRSGGIYKIGSDTTSWLSSQAQLRLYSKPSASCGNGYVGYDQSGNYIREFGTQSCSTDFDVNTTRF